MSTSRHRRLTVLAAALVCAGLLPAAAQAHAFLVHSDPPAGARLALAPPRLVLRFSEPYLRGSERVALRRADGPDVALDPPSGRGVLVVQPLPGGLRGIFVASWRVVSDDGHVSFGEIAFSVGAAGALPAVSGSSTPTSWPQAAATWLFFLGLALAFGGLLSERFILRSARPHAPVMAGAAVAAFTSVALLVLLAGDRAGGGFGAGLHGSTVRSVLVTRPGALTLAAFAAIVAAALVTASRTRALALVPLATAAVLTSVRGHSGTGGHWWAPVIDSIHLLAAAAWVGALVHLLVVVTLTPDRGAVVRRYSRLALPTVLVILASGVLTAFGEFRSVHSAFHTGYGQTLIVKAALVLAALAVAAASRMFTISSGGIRVPLLRRLTATEATLLVTVLAVVGLLVNLAPPRTPAASALGPLTVVGPGVIPTGPFVAAREAGDLAVGFAAQPAGANLLRLTATVIGGDGKPAVGLGLGARLLSISESRGPAVACGRGCYTVTLAFSGTPRTALVTIRRAAHLPAVVRFDFPSVWPPPSAVRLAREATVVFSRLRTVTFDERLGSSPTNVLHARWRLEAPNKLTYAIQGGPQAVLIGDRRWDRDPGGPWVESPQLPVRQPTPTWSSAPVRAALLGSGQVNGRAVWRVSFVEPNAPAWFTVAIDKQTLRTLELSMVAPAHFMHQVYGGFDEPPSIKPPPKR